VWRRPGPDSWEATGEPRTWPLLLGESDGEPVTLLDCQSTHFESQLFGNPIAQTLIAMQAFVGIHLDVPDQVAFKAISIKIENLHAWTAATGLSEQVEFEDGRQRGPVIRADFPEEQSACVADYRITLVHSFFTGGEFTRSGTTARIAEAVELSIEPVEGLRSAANLFAFGKPLQDLITLATDRPAAVLSMVLVAPPTDDASACKDGAPQHDRTVHVHQKQVVDADPEATALRPHELLFSLADIGFEKIIPTWFGLHEDLRSACNMLFGLHYIQEGYLQDRLVIAVSAAEALHRQLSTDPPMSDEEFKALRKQASDAVPAERRQWVRDRLWNEPTLKERLLYLASLPASEAVDALVPDRERWATSAKKARNALVHRTKKKGHSPSIDEMIAVAEVTRALLTLVLMAQAGLSPVVQQRIVRQSPKFQRVCQVARRHLSAKSDD